MMNLLHYYNYYRNLQKVQLHLQLYNNGILEHGSLKGHSKSYATSAQPSVSDSSTALRKCAPCTLYSYSDSDSYCKTATQ